MGGLGWRGRTMLVGGLALVLAASGMQPSLARPIEARSAGFGISGQGRIGAQAARPAAFAAGAPVVYLTFDDGPWPTYTDQMLSLLARYNARATFFELGRQVVLLARHLAADRGRRPHGGEPQLHPRPPHGDERGEILGRGGRHDPRDRAHRGPVGRLPAPAGRGGRLHGAGAGGGPRSRHRAVDCRPEGLHEARASVIASLVSRVRPGSIVLLHDGGVTARRRSRPWR